MNIDTIPASTDGQRSQDRPAAVAPASTFHGGPINILIVDDEPKNLTVLETVLDNPGYRLVRAESANQALLALVDEEFALLILDIRMPDMTGFELAQLIKERKKTARVPILFLTAYYNEDHHVLEGYETGAVDYLHKPVNPAILRSKVAVFAELHRKSRTLLAEVAERHRAQEQLRALNETLEQRVTERTAALVKTSAALKETSERYRSLFEGSLDAIFSLGADERFEAANPAALRLTARTLEELKTIRFLDLCEPNQREATDNAFRAAFRRQCFAVDTTVLTAAGERRDLFISGAPEMVDGEVVGVACIACDVTERKQAEEAVQQSAARLDGIISSAMDAIITIDQKQCVTDFNNSAEQMFGCAAADAVGQPIDRFIPKQSWAMQGGHIEPFGNTDVTKRQMGALGTIYGHRANGEEFPIEASISQSRIQAGKFYTVILRDMTERVRQEEALRLNEERYRTLFAAAPMALFVCDRNAVIQYYNHRAVELWGREPTVGIEQHCGSVKLWLPDNTLLPHAQSPIVEVLRTGIPATNIEVFIERPDGSRMPVLVNFAALKDAKGEITGAITSFINITDRKRVEEALRENEERFRTLADNMAQFAWTADITGWIFWYNRRWYEYTGTTFEEMQGWGWEKVNHPDHLDRVVKKWRQAHTTGEPWEDTFPLRGRDGTYRWFLSRALPIRDAEGRIVRWFGTNTDITELRETQASLHASEGRLRQLTDTLEERVKERTQQLSTSYARLRALATDLTVAEQTERRRLATELHDYLAQLLVVTRMKLAQLLRQDHDSEVRKILQDADQLLHQSLDYTRSLVSELTPQALYERGLAAALRWLGDHMRRNQVLNVEISLDAPELPLPETDAVLLFHSIRELLFNVLKHGKIDRASVSMRYAQNVLSITVSDHGCGFDVSRLSDDRSDRFGLLSIRERMTALGGSFDLQSEPGKGTVASLHLPFTASGEGIETQVAAAPRRPPGPGSAPPSPSEANVVTPLRVLIVDDHQMVREGLCCILKQHDDLTVVGEASTGEQALQLAGTLMPEVVIMDMHMPGWNGAESTRRILKEYPSTVVIGLSIQTDPHIAESMLDAGAAAFLPKETIGNELYSTIQTAVHRMTSSKSVTSRPSA